MKIFLYKKNKRCSSRTYFLKHAPRTQRTLLQGSSRVVTKSIESNLSRHHSARNLSGDDFLGFMVYFMKHETANFSSACPESVLCDDIAMSNEQQLIAANETPISATSHSFFIRYEK